MNPGSSTRPARSAPPPADLDRLFHALGDPTRRAMVETLSRGALSVSHLARAFPLTLAAVVQHLQILEVGGLVRSEKVGRVRTCTLAPEGLRTVEHWINTRRTDWEQRLDRLGDLLTEPESTE